MRLKHAGMGTGMSLCSLGYSLVIIVPWRPGTSGMHPRAQRYVASTSGIAFLSGPLAGRLLVGWLFIANSSACLNR